MPKGGDGDDPPRPCSSDAPIWQIYVVSLVGSTCFEFSDAASGLSARGNKNDSRLSYDHRIFDSQDLISEELVDCLGRTTYRLVLDIDGIVRVTLAAHGVTVHVDPADQTVLTPGVVLPDEVMRAAANLRPY